MKAFTALCFCLFSCASFAAEDVLYKHDGTEYQGYFSSPQKDAPLVILLHDWDGLTEYEKKRARMLNDEGYAVFAADLFGKGVRPTKMEDKRQHTGELYNDRQKMRAVLNAGLKAAEEQGARVDAAVALGYCFGGAAALEWARSAADLKGFITVHGGLGTPEEQNYDNAKGSYLIQHGAADESVTMDQFAQLALQMQRAGLDFHMEVYGGAPHAWTVFGGDRYHQHADELAWQNQLEFLSKTLK